MSLFQRRREPPTPAVIVLADALWRETAPGALHVLAGEAAAHHPLVWVEPPVTEKLKAPGLRGRLRRSLRLDLPAVRYVDARRELDVATPPLVPAGNAVGDALLAQTVTWLLRARHASARVLWLARRGPEASALARRLKPAVTVDWHDDPQPGDTWCPEADLVIWPAWAPMPAGASDRDERLVRWPDMGVRAALAFQPTLEAWLSPTLRIPIGPELRSVISP